MLLYDMTVTVNDERCRQAFNAAIGIHNFAVMEDDGIINPMLLRERLHRFQTSFIYRNAYDRESQCGVFFFAVR